MKESTSSAQRDALIADCRQILVKIPTIKQLSAGSPAMTPRDVVDNSYAVGLCVTFDDRAGHDVYQSHPLHNDFVTRNKTHWQRVQVYDFVQ
ncbi:MAG TPA: Dabb family protein [Tepidisphaeraceae bacterium]|nr:Dabb family protein [Tepidisphaeraceae bacterium]